MVMIRQHLTSGGHEVIVMSMKSPGFLPHITAPGPTIHTEGSRIGFATSYFYPTSMGSFHRDWEHGSSLVQGATPFLGSFGRFLIDNGNSKALAMCKRNLKINV